MDPDQLQELTEDSVEQNDQKHEGEPYVQEEEVLLKTEGTPDVNKGNMKIDDGMLEASPFAEQNQEHSKQKLYDN